jgi:hypothetical protein
VVKAVILQADVPKSIPRSKGDDAAGKLSAAPRPVVEDADVPGLAIVVPWKSRFDVSATMLMNNRGNKRSS